MEAELVHTFDALADPARLAMIELLGERPLCSSEIADALALSRPATSRHLGVLRKAGLVAETTLADDARVRVYRLRQEPLSRVRRWVDQVEAFWTLQLDAFKAHAEKRARKSRP